MASAEWAQCMKWRENSLLATNSSCAPECLPRSPPPEEWRAERLPPPWSSSFILLCSSPAPPPLWVYPPRAQPHLANMEGFGS